MQLYPQSGSSSYRASDHLLTREFLWAAVACGTLTTMAKGSRVQRRLEKSVFNPAIRSALRIGIAPRAFALLETTGRRSGELRRTPVGNGLDGHVFWLVSEHGRHSSYVKNLIADPRVRVKVGRRWYSGTAVILDDDDAHARRRRLDAANGLIGQADGIIFRASASVPVTVRISLDQ